MGSSILQQLGRQQLEQAQTVPPAGKLNANLALTEQRNVAELNEADELARLLALPREQVLGNITAARAKATQIKAERLATQAPVSAQWAGKTPERTAISQPSWDNMSRMERLFGKVEMPKPPSGIVIPAGERPGLARQTTQGLLGAEWDRTTLNLELGRLQFNLTPAQRALPENRQKITELRDKIASYQLPESNGMAEMAMRSAAQILPSIASGGAAGTIAALVAGTVAFATGAPVAATAATVFGAGMLSRAITEQGGLDIDKNVQVPGADPVVADIAGRASGLASGALEYAGQRFLLKPFGDAAKRLLSNSTDKILQAPTTRQAIINGVKTWGGSVVVETATEVGQQALSLASEQVVRSAADAPGIEGGRVIEELVETAVTTAAGMALLGIPGGGVRTLSDLGRVEQAKETQAFLTALGEEADKVDLRTTSPSEFQSFVNEVVQMYGPVRDIMIPVEQFNAYWQSRNIDPRTVAAEIVPDVALYDQAAATGSDFVIPLADYVAKVAPTEHHAALQEDIRFRPDDLTFREAKALESTVNQDIEGLHEELVRTAEEVPTDTSAQRLVEDITAKITATGVYTPDQVAAQAQAIAAPYIVLARRAGRDPYEVYQERNIAILDPAKSERLFDAMAEMETLLAADPTSPEAVAAVERVNALRAEIEATPETAQALVPMVMPLSAVADGQRVTLPDGRSGTVVSREGEQVTVRVGRKTMPMEATREVQVAPVALRQDATPPSPTPTLERTTNLTAAFDLARKNKFARNRDFKQALQDRALEAGAQDGIDPTTLSPEVLDYLVRVGIQDANYAIKANPNAIGWYERKVKAALAVVSEIYPEITTDQDARFAFIFALATTSNGQKVDMNFRLASDVYRQYRESKQMPTDVKAGTAQGAINSSLALFNELAKQYGMEKFRRMTLTQFPVGTLKAMGFNVTGEHVDVIVRGAAIVGPKIGNGFFSNLYGFFDALTMDRWLMRTWGRWTGTLLEVDPADVAKKSAELSALVGQLDPAARTELQGLLKLTLDEEPGVIAERIAKVSMKPKSRAAMNAIMVDGKDLGEQIRKKGNNLKNTIDGQKEAPSGAQERKLIRSVFSRILQDVKTRVPEMTMADLQAVLWYPEKKLYDSAVLEADEAETEYADNEAPDYANAAAKLARSVGIPEERIQDAIRNAEADGRAGVVQRDLEGTVIEPGTSPDDVGLSRRDFRNLVTGSILRDLRSNRSRDGKTSDAYSRKGRADREGVRLLGTDVPVLAEYRPGVVFKNRIPLGGGKAPIFYELASGSTEAVDAFTQGITTSKNESEFGAAVYIYPPAEYAAMRLFLSDDGQTGFALKPDGDIVSVFSRGGGGGRGAMELAIQLGGKKLDAFDTVLPEYYAAHGMREVARMPWNDERTPDGWDAATFAEFNGGRPDVVFMVFDPDLPAEVAPYVANDDAALKKQADAITVVAERQARQSVPEMLQQAVTPPDADPAIKRLIRGAFRTPQVFVDLPATIDIDGVQRPTRNSKGQQIARDERTMRNFWRWFGESKVVDEQGRPIPMYHGTEADVDFVEFKPNTSELGIHLGTTEQANRFASGISSALDQNRVTQSAGSRVYELYARLSNPLRLSDRGGFISRGNVLDQLVDLGVITEDERVQTVVALEGVQGISVQPKNRPFRQVEQLTIRLLKDKGYDGIVYLNRFEGYTTEEQESGAFKSPVRSTVSDETWQKKFPSATDSYIVFDPQQLKSTVNVGSFSRALKNILRQSESARPNAFIIPGVARTTIGLMRTANLSSLLHEFSHDYLNLLFDLATPDAPAEIRADADLVLKEFGITDRGQLTTEHQEKWARMFESYLMEGKSPSRELQSAFGRFRVWLTAIYRAVTNALVPVSPEIRGIFDRMLASDAQIAEALNEDELGPLFTSAEEAGMSEAEFTAYTGAVTARDEQAKRILLTKLLAEQNKERRQIWKDRASELRRTVTEQVQQEPVQQAVHFLKTGMLITGEPLPEGVTAYKLSKALLVARYGPEVTKSLPRGVYGPEGVDPDVVALAFGFDSGDAMITQMQAYEPMNQRIDRIVKETMAREFPDLLGDSPALADAAQDAVHQAPTDQLLYRELIKLGQLDAMIPSVNLFAVRMAAKDVIAKTRIRDVMPERFRRAEAKAGRLAYRSMRQGNPIAAAFHKRQQLLNHLLYREATEAIELANQTYTFFGKMAKGSYQERLGKGGQAYLEQMNALLEQYDFARISGAEMERRQALSEWAAAQVQRGIPVEISASVLYNTQRMNYRMLTVEQLQGVYDTGRQIYHVARNEGKLLAAAQRASFEETVVSIVSGIASHRKIEPREPDYAPSKLKAVANFLKKVDAWHVKPEFLFRWLDGDEALGPVHQALFEPIAQAENAESAMVVDANKRVEELFNLIPKARRKEFLTRRIQVPGVSTRMTGATAVSVALNWGNPSNREALLEGTIGGRPVFTPQQVDAILATLTKDEWTFVQSVWDYINEFWPQIASLQQSLTGVAPEKIAGEAFTVTTADGEAVNLRGGYYPLAYDQNYSWAQFKQDMAADVQDIGGNSYTRAATKHGFTESRVGSGGRPVKLDLSVFSEHVLNVIHDLTHRKAILDVQRLAENAEVREAIEGTAGRDLYRTIRPWLVRVAGDRRPPASPVEDLVGRARTGVTVVNMGLKVTTAIVQPIGYLQSVDMLGANYARRGLTAFFANPKKITELVKEQSVAIRTRQQSFDRDVRDQTKRLLKKGPMTKAQESFFFFTGLMDMSVAIPTWYGAYLKSIETLKPGDQHAAVTYADGVVRMTQGSGAAKDLSQVQGGNELMRPFTLFYTYFNALYNLLRRSGALLKDRGPRDVPRFLGSMAVLWFLPAVLSELIAGRGPDEEEDEDAMQWALWKLVRYPFSTVVLARDIAAAIGPEAYEYELSPVVSAGRSVTKSLNAIYNAVHGTIQGDDFELTEGQVKEFVLAIGYWGQLPSRQMWITGSYLYDWMMGYEEPEQPAEALRGLAFPRQK